MNQKDQILKYIQQWEEAEGENFFENFVHHIDMKQFAYWCYGKGLIAENELDYYLTEPLFLEIDMLVGSEDYSIVNEEENEAYAKGNEVLAEFLGASTFYQNEVKVFVEKTKEVPLEEVLNQWRDSDFYRYFYHDNGKEVYASDDMKWTLSALGNVKWYRKELD